MNESEINTDYLETCDGTRLAYEFSEGSSPTIVFLGGYHSEMSGTKGNWLAKHCARQGHSFLRLDYYGHGLSEGMFEDGTIGRWKSDAIAVIKHRVSGPMVLVGSSMGGWIMLLVARELGECVKGMVGIAAAPDFTRDLMWNVFSKNTRDKLEKEGIVHLGSEYDETSYPIRLQFIEEGSRHLLLDQPIAVNCPVRLLQGRRDPDVPWQTAERLMTQLESDDVHISYFKEGDHRLSEDKYLKHLSLIIEELLQQLGRQ